MKLLKWMRILLSGKPHFYIGGRERPYMLRWHLLPRNQWLNVYLHKFCRDDDNRALHDHPWWFVSVMLKGAYSEVLVDDPEWGTRAIARFAPDIAYRPATHRHRVVLDRRDDGSCVPAWTLVFTGRNVREWGFHCGERFVPWYEFVDDKDRGSVGKGCSE